MEKIDRFTGKYGFLSNFWPVSITVPMVFKEYSLQKGRDHFRVHNLTFPSTEHAYQAAKCLDESYQKKFADENMTAGQAKRLGKKANLREDWHDISLGVMELVVEIKFRENASLRKMLLATGDAELIEGNHWGDVFWGTCNGVGLNHLGKILMKVREELKNV